MISGLAENERVRWIIVPVSFTKNDTIQKIEMKIPAHVQRCVGIIYSLLDVDDADYSEFAELSLKLNNDEQHPVNMILSSKRNVNLKRKHEPLEIIETLESGKFIKGYLKDLGVITVGRRNITPRSSYTVNIYLKTVVKKW